jgi:hypothetical protein
MRSARFDFENPAALAGLRFNLLVYNEQVRRRVILADIQADLQGGHSVIVWLGNEPDRYAAYCDPRSADEGEYCWIGPDRDSIEEALVDGQRHHPDYEPEVHPGVAT